MTPLFLLLKDEKQSIMLFLNCLQREQAALVAAQVEQLGSINQEKLGLIERLNDIELRRLQMTGRSSAGDNGSMDEWFGAHPEEADAARIWPEILKLAREARKIHHTNGEFIQMHLDKTRETIAVLTHRQKEIGLYGSDGQASNQGGSRLVDSA